MINFQPISQNTWQQLLLNLPEEWIMVEDEPRGHRIIIGDSRYPSTPFWRLDPFGSMCIAHALLVRAGTIGFGDLPQVGGQAGRMSGDGGEDPEELPYDERVVLAYLSTLDDGFKADSR